MLPVPWQKRYAYKLEKAREALKIIDRGVHIFIGSGLASPQLLIEELPWWAAALS